MSTITIEMLVARVEVLEKQMASLLGDTTAKKKDKKNKKSQPNTDSDGEIPKKKSRISGYILFGKAVREEVKHELFPDGEKVLSSKVMSEIGARWKALDEDEKKQWNEKAQNIKDSDE